MCSSWGHPVCSSGSTSAPPLDVRQGTHGHAQSRLGTAPSDNTEGREVAFGNGRDPGAAAQPRFTSSCLPEIPGQPLSLQLLWAGGRTRWQLSPVHTHCSKLPYSDTQFCTSSWPALFWHTLYPLSTTEGSPYWQETSLKSPSKNTFCLTATAWVPTLCFVRWQTRQANYLFNISEPE